MKKIIALITLLLICVNLSNAELSLRKMKISIGLDWEGTLENKVFGIYSNVDTEFGISASVDFPIVSEKWFTLGLGAEFQFPRDTVYNLSSNHSLHFIPLYSYLNIIIHQNPNWKIGKRSYLIGRVGGNIFLDSTSDLVEDTEGGFYYGIGLGFHIIRNFVFEGIYSVNNGTEFWKAFSNERVDAKYKKITLYLGINVG